MLTIKHCLVVLTLGLTSTACAQADTSEPLPPTVQKVVDAYGGKALTEATAIRVISDVRSGSAGQGFSPTYAERFQVRRDAYFDMSGDRGSSEIWGGRKGVFSYNDRVVITPEGFGNINYQTGHYSIDPDTGFYDSFGAGIRTSDTLLALELFKRAESAELSGTQNFHGRPHDLLTFEMPNSPTLTLFVDQETGHISQMQRSAGPAVLSYVFNNHKKTDGITFAREYLFYVGTVVTEYTVSRSIEVNPDTTSVFTIEDALTTEPDSLSTAELTIDEIADGVHHVGQNFAYTLFVDAGDHIIGVGNSAGLADRLAAYHAERGHAKPLRYQIVTHHHSDHLDSIPDAVAAGAIIVTPESALPNINAALETPLAEDRLQLVTGQTTLGPVRIDLISTGHVETFASVYVPAAKTLFQVDHYNNNFIEKAASVNGAGVTYRKEIEALGLVVETLLSGHGRKAERWTDFFTSADAHDPRICASGRPICADVE